MGKHRANSKDFSRILTGAIAAGVVSIPLAGVAAAEPPPSSPGTHGDVAVSVNGKDVKTSSNPLTDATSSPRTSTGGANVAIARNSSRAFATSGTGNKARASNHSAATATTGDNNTATATDYSLALARQGDNNTATASDGTAETLSVALAQNGDNNTATATCSGFANASGDGQTVTSDGGAC